jgi:hypothetical protein
VSQVYALHALLSLGERLGGSGSGHSRCSSGTAVFVRAMYKPAQLQILRLLGGVKVPTCLCNSHSCTLQQQRLMPSSHVEHLDLLSVYVFCGCICATLLAMTCISLRSHRGRVSPSADETAVVCVVRCDDPKSADMCACVQAVQHIAAALNLEE